MTVGTDNYEFQSIRMGGNGYKLAQIVTDEYGFNNLEFSDVVFWVVLELNSVITPQIPISKLDIDGGFSQLTLENIVKLSCDKSRRLVKVGSSSDIKSGCLMPVTLWGTD